MSNIFSIVGSAWDFQRKHPVLMPVLFWLIILPMTGTNIIMRFLASASGMITMDLSPAFIIAWLGILLFQLILLWGIASIFLIGGRLLTSSAGRSRSSFRAVRNQALTFIIPLFLTQILRTCITFLWSLLFLVPGIIYQIRTAFYAVIIVCERVSYRAALDKSKEIVRGQTWRILKYLLGLSLLIFVPAYVLILLTTSVVHMLDDRFIPVTDLVDGTINGISTLLFTLSLVILYRDLKRSPRLVPPPPIDGTP